MKPHKHAELIKAWAEGLEVEFSNGDFQGWRPVLEENHCWRNDTYYRIKPASPKWPETTMTNEMLVSAYFGGGNVAQYREYEAWARIANAALRHACETGQLVLPDPERDMKIAKAAWIAGVNSESSNDLEQIIKEATK